MIIHAPEPNTEFIHRHDVINSVTRSTDSYLEIGVENGFTFLHTRFEKKVGVDPIPKCIDNRIIKCTSDTFFKDNDDTFDVIFIDGMHKVEYFLEDLNHSIKCLNENGKIFVDDILPIFHDEQLKIPIKHCFEQDILKYGEPWTGDIWKIMYYVLRHFADMITFKYYINHNYRGIGMIQVKKVFQLEKAALHEINEYHYHRDYNDYISLLSNV
jgi:hypothetical protein